MTEIPDLKEGKINSEKINFIASPGNTTPQHVQDMVIGNPNTMVKDRHPLWRNFRNNNYERPFMHGVVGPQWQVPVAEDDRGFKHIASPMPKPEVIRRILPNDLPPVTYSPSSFDLPMRKDVVQVDIPPATIRTVEENIDPRNPPKRPVTKVSGTLYHGTGSTDEKVVHGFPPSFIQKNSKRSLSHSKSKSKNKHKSRFHHKSHKHTLHCVHNIKAEVPEVKNNALSHASAAEGEATHMLNRITNNLNHNPHMVLDVDLVNKYEQPDLKIHEHNQAAINRQNQLRRTVAGVRAAHAFRKLP